MKELKFDNIEDLLNILQSDDISLQNIRWIEPISIAILKLYKIVNPDINIFLRSDKRDVHKYINIILEPSQNNGTTYMPFKEFSGDIDKICKDIVDLLFRNITNISNNDKDDFRKYLQYMMSEMMDNVISHSESHIGGFVTAQYYSKKKKVQVVIIDNGIGLLQSLSNKYTLSNESEAIKKAIEKEVTGSNTYSTYNNTPKHAGLGLYFLSRIIQETKGKLLIVSNDTIYRSTNNACQQFNTNFKGTMIAFELLESNLEYEFKDLFNIIKNDDELGEEEDVF